MTTGRLQIVEPLAITQVASSVGGDSGVANLITDDPKEVYQASSNTLRNIYLDLGNALEVNALFVGFTNADTATAELFPTTGFGTGVGAGMGAQTIKASDAKAVRTSKLLRYAASQNSRYWLVQLAGNTAALQIGRIAVGATFEASWDREWGSGRGVVDTAKVEPLLGGGFGVQPGARKASYGWTFGDLTDTETEQLWGIAYRVGRSSPLIVNEFDGATTAANERLHYGLLQRLEKFERRDPNATKWAFELEEWI